MEKNKEILVAEIDYGLETEDYSNLLAAHDFVACEGGPEGAAG